MNTNLRTRNEILGITENAIAVKNTKLYKMDNNSVAVIEIQILKEKGIMSDIPLVLGNSLEAEEIKSLKEKNSYEARIPINSREDKETLKNFNRILSDINQIEKFKVEDSNQIQKVANRSSYPIYYDSINKVILNSIDGSNYWVVGADGGAITNVIFWKHNLDRMGGLKIIEKKRNKKS